MNIPLISIIVPVYNAEKTLNRCFDSILSQTFQDWELLLIDDGSTDQSRELCDEYANKDSRVRVFHKINEGVSSARNVGLDNAKGQWITFVDADDWIDKNMYQELYNTAVSTQADIVLCSFYEYHGLGKTFLIEAISTESDKIEILRNYILSFTALWNILVHRTLYDTYKLRIPKHITNCEDFWLTVRLFYYAKQISSLHIPLYYYNRENVNSILNNPNEERRNSEYLSYIDTINFFQSNGVLNLYEKEISWRILKCKQDLVLIPELHHRFLTMYPPSHHYILSCPTSLCNRKIKLLMWLLVHKMSFCVVLFCKIRTLIGRN